MSFREFREIFFLIKLNKLHKKKNQDVAKTIQLINFSFFLIPITNNVNLLFIYFVNHGLQS